VILSLYNFVLIYGMRGNFLIGTRYSTTHFHASLCLPTPTAIPNISEVSAHCFAVSDPYSAASDLPSLCLKDSGLLRRSTASLSASVCRRSSVTTTNTNQLSERLFPATLNRQTTAVVTTELSAFP